MPVLMVALLALAAFGVIGGLLAAATILERKNKTDDKEPGAKPA
jgi:hypothetical protein